MNPKPHIFIHIPKTGGWTIRQLPHINSYVHHTASQVKQDNVHFDQVFKFAFIRNPFDRFLSAYSFYAQMDSTHRFWHLEADRKCALTVQQYKNFEDFVLNFDTFKFKSRVHFLPQSYFITDNNKLLIDYVGHFETYDQSWFEICDRLNIPRVILNKTNQSQHESFENYYSPETYSIVKTIYQSDFKQQLFQQYR